LKRNSIIIRKLIFLFVVLILLCISQLTFSQEIRKDVMIPMSDDVKLAANITLPETKGHFPVILVRTPYGKDNEEEDEGGYWAANGFGFVQPELFV